MRGGQRSIAGTYSITLHYLRSSLSTNLELHISPRLASQWAPGSCLFLSHQHWGYMCTPIMLGALAWVLGIQTQVLIIGPAFYPLNHLQSQIFLTQGLLHNKQAFHTWVITTTHIVNSLWWTRKGSSCVCNYRAQKAEATVGSQFTGQRELYSKTLAGKITNIYKSSIRDLKQVNFKSKILNIQWW